MLPARPVQATLPSFSRLSDWQQQFASFAGILGVIFMFCAWQDTKSHQQQSAWQAGDAEVRSDMHSMEGRLRSDMHSMEGRLRGDMQQLRSDMQQMEGRLHRDLHLLMAGGLAALVYMEWRRPR